MKFWVVESKIDLDVYFLLREDKTEIRIKVANNMLSPSDKLTPEEANYFREEGIIEVVSYHSCSGANKLKIITMHLSGVTDTDIAHRIGENYRDVTDITTAYWKEKMDNKSPNGRKQK